MKLYLSSYRVPVPEELAQLVGKPLNKSTLAIIPNAKDYYSERARNFKVNTYVKYFESLGLKVEVVDLCVLGDSDELKARLEGHDIIWAIGGNTFCLRYEMNKNNFKNIISSLISSGVVYGGDSAGALVAGPRIGGFGIEIADTPEFAEKKISEGLGLIPYIIVPHVDSPDFTEITELIRNNLRHENVIELKDSQAVVFNGKKHYIVDINKR